MNGDMVEINSNVFIPMPVTLIGTRIEGRVNFMAAGWVTRINADPPQIGVGIHQSHATSAAIRENGAFSVCFPDRSLVAETDYCGIVSGKKEDKSNLFSVFYGNSENAPMIAEAMVNLECRVVETVRGRTNDFFIADIRGAWASSTTVKDGKLDTQNAGFLLLTMPDNTYWTLGEPIARAWEIGRTVKK